MTKGIRNNQEFLNLWEEFPVNARTVRDTKLNFSPPRTQLLEGMGVNLNGLTLGAVDTLYGVDFEFLTFTDCRFYAIDFVDLKISACRFIGCVFDQCRIVSSGFYESEFKECVFNEPQFADVQIADCEIIDFTVMNSIEILDVYFGGCVIQNLSFNNSSLASVRFGPIRELMGNSLLFNSCAIAKCLFTNITLENSIFDECLLSETAFNNCRLSKKTFSENCSSKDNIYNYIDLQTLRANEPISAKVLKSVFGIHNPDVKDYILEITSEVTFQTVFISYSFKDQEFTKKINEALRSRGVSTFLWEKDAPGGKRLKEIMEENINRLDRVLFISSINSIQSDACQFELTKGREKGIRQWKNIMFPIHLDTYLFSVRADDVRPREKISEYWANIIELKEMNSMDFSSFRNEGRENYEFNRLVDKLVYELRKNT